MISFVIYVEKYGRKKDETPSGSADSPDSPEYFFVKVEYSLVKIILKEITHIEGMKDYVKIFLNSAPRPVLTKSTLKGISEKLPLANFMRVHKSYIIGLKHIHLVQNNRVLIGEREIPISNSYKETFLKFIEEMGNWLWKHVFVSPYPRSMN